MFNIFVFDIETIPDIAAGRQLYDLHDLPDHEVAEAMFTLRRQESGGSEFLRHHLHQIIAISVAFRSRDDMTVWSLGTPDSNEKEIVQRFFSGLEKYTPTLVSWNGGGFDLPVLHYRSLLHGISAPRYWDIGNDDQSFKWNNYLNRFHYRHIDLMDVLAGYQMRANASLDNIAVLLGLPGKMGMSGGKVWESFQAGDIVNIRNYCETDVLNTYLIYLRFELIRGNLNETQYQQECELVADMLKTSDKPHFTAFLDAWKN